MMYVHILMEIEYLPQTHFVMKYARRWDGLPQLPKVCRESHLRPLASLREG